MEMGLLFDYFGIFSTCGEKYYFHVEGSMQGEIEPKQHQIEMNIETNILAWGRGVGTTIQPDKSGDKMGVGARWKQGQDGEMCGQIWAGAR